MKTLTKAFIGLSGFPFGNPGSFGMPGAGGGPGFVRVVSCVS